MLYLFGINITFFLSLLLFTKKNKSDADKILATWLLFTGIHLVLFYIHVSGKYTLFPYLLGLEIPLPLVHSPFLYLYTLSLTNQSKKDNSRLLHFFPFVVMYILLYGFLTSSFQNKIYVYQHNGVGYETIMMFLNVLIIAQGIIYMTLSYLQLKKHAQNILDKFSNTERVNLNWLRYLLLGTSIIWLAIIFGNDDVIFSLVVLYIIFIGYFGIKQVGIFTQKENIVFESVAENNNLYTTLNFDNDILPIDDVQENDYTEIAVSTVTNIKYQKSTLSANKAQEIYDALGQLMLNEKIFKNAELTIGDVAEKLNVSSNHLSQVINTFEKRNFFDYINLLRVESFKQNVHLPENQQFTFLSLAFESGFNSKTSFNRNFKKVTGLSPSEYLKKENIRLLEK